MTPFLKNTKRLKWFIQEPLSNSLITQYLPIMRENNTFLQFSDQSIFRNSDY